MLFDQNMLLGGFEAGRYDLHAVHPTNVNWTRQSRYSGPNKPILQYEYKMGSIVRSSVVVDADSIVYFGAENGAIYSFKEGEGVKPIFAAKHSLGTPTIGEGGIIYVGSYETVNSKGHKLYAINKDGTEKWDFKTDYLITSTPVIDNEGTIYVTTEDARLYAINPDGTLKWIVKENIVFSTEPAISNQGDIFIASGDKHLYVLNKDGAEKRSLYIGTRSDQSNVIIDDKGIFYICVDNGKQTELLAIRESEILWRYHPKDGEVWTSPVLAQNGHMYLGGNFFRLLSLELNGDTEWETKVKGYYLYPPVVDSSDNIYTLTFDSVKDKAISRITSFKPDSSINWEYECEGVITCPVIMPNNKMVFLAYDWFKGTTKLIVLSGN